MVKIKVFEAGVADAKLRKAWAEDQVLVIKNMSRAVGSRGTKWSDLCQFYKNQKKIAEKNWTCESGASRSAKDVFAKRGAGFVNGKSGFYASFIAQNERPSDSSFSKLIKKEKMLHDLPVQKLLFLDGDYIFAPSFWFFFGHSGTVDNCLKGKAEHIDAVSNNGTFHLQVSGRKTWTIRADPNASWKNGIGNVPGKGKRVKVVCEAGDLILINTRKWYHSTEISCGFSLSYARDIFCKDSDEHETEVKQVFSSWATDAIPENTILLEEKPLSCVQLVSNANSYPACDFCGGHLGTPAHQCAVFDGAQARHLGGVKLDKIGLPDIPSAKHLNREIISSGSSFFCSKECAAKSAHLTADMHRLAVSSGHYEIMILAHRLVVFLSKSADSDCRKGLFERISILKPWWDEIDGSVGNGVILHTESFAKSGLKLNGVKIISVAKNSAAEKCGLLKNDIIQTVNGVRVSTTDQDCLPGVLIDSCLESSKSQFESDWFNCKLVGIRIGLMRSKVAAIDLKSIAQEWYRKFLRKQKVFNSITEKQFYQLLSYVSKRAITLENTMVPNPLSVYLEEASGCSKSIQSRIRKCPGWADIGSVCQNRLSKTIDLGKVAELSHGYFPHFEGVAFYNRIATLPIEGQENVKGEEHGEANCKVVWAGNGLEAWVVSTKDIGSGEQLVLESFNDDEEIEEETPYGDDLASVGAPSEEAPEPPKKRRKTQLN